MVALSRAQTRAVELKEPSGSNTLKVELDIELKEFGRVSARAQYRGLNIELIGAQCRASLVDRLNIEPYRACRAPHLRGLKINIEVKK